MKKSYYHLQLLCLLLVLSFSVAAQKNLWTDILESKIAVNQDQKKVLPEKYRTLSLDTSGLLSYLESAPMEFTDAAKSKPVILMLPMPDGSYSKFRIVKTVMMEAGLAAQFPNIKTFGGQGIDDPYASVKIDWSQLGFHAMVLSPVNGAVFIDPYANKLSKEYVSYRKVDFRHLQPFYEEGNNTETGKLDKAALQQRTQAGQCIGGTLKTYRLAVACTGEYARAIGFGTNVTQAQALAAIVTSVNRVNGVYETELAIRLSLVNNNTNIVFTDPATDPFNGNKKATTLINESQHVIDSIIKPANYDMGHTFSTGAGGLAAQGIVCQNGDKAKGVTGLANPIGDPYDIDFVAHEMGHEVGASHPFNAATGNCGGNGVSNTNAEPGSGSTIMAYAGICGSKNDLQPHSDPQFHAVSLDEITAYTINGAGHSCAAETATGNTAPVVNAGNNYSIPKSTPFVLTGSATDADSDPLTYSWEQTDVGGPFGDWDKPVGNVPLFRSFPPVTTPVRYFPKISDVVNNDTTIGEILPSYGRTMHFRLTARDNRAGGGGVCFDEIAVGVSGSAGPFVVTEPNTNVSWTVGNFKTITWNVAGSNIAPVNCANVAIELSTDGGLTFPVTIMSTTPNDGQEEIIVPNNVTAAARIRVRSVGNIFYDISDKNFAIQASQENTFVFSNPEPVIACANGTTGTVISTNGLNGFSNLITLSASGNPAGTMVVFSGNPINPGSSDSISLQGNIPDGVYSITITGTAGSVVKTKIIQFTIGSPAEAPVNSSPADNSIGQPLNPTLEWFGVSGALSYTLQISESPTFNSFVQNINGLTGNSYTLTTALASNTEYYWRVLANNQCGSGPASQALRFKTAQISCDNTNSTDVPVTIPTTVSTINSTLIINSGGIISDLNVIGLKGKHTFIHDLKVSLISPANTEVVLFNSICGSDSNFDMNFDDEASNAAIPCPPIGGVTRRPMEALSAFDNENSTGTWTLRIKDNAKQDGGSLNNWGLQICTSVATALPVKWLSFTGHKNEDYTASLQWSTANETNNDHYELERSIDGVHFSLIGTVTAGDRPGTTQQYSYNDRHPNSGINYYRLAQVDRDGRRNFSKIVTVTFEKSGEQYIVYPNPATEVSTVRIMADMKQATLRLYDALGQVLYEKSMKAIVAGEEIRLPVKRLSKGLYILSVITEKGASSQKIIVK